MGADCVDDAWIRVIPCRLAVEDREEDVDEACSCARSMIDAGVEEEEALTLLLFFEEAKDAEGTVRDAEVFKILLIEEVDDAGKAALLLLLSFGAVLAFARQLVKLRAEDAGGAGRVAVVVADVEALRTLPVEDVDDADRAALLLLSFEAVLAFARQSIGLRAEDAGGAGRVAVVVADVEALRTLLVEDVNGANKAALLLLLFFEAVPALAELIGLRTEDAGVAEVLMAMLIALPALVLRSGVPSDLSPDAAVAVVALEGGRITLDAAGEVDRVGCFSIDWTVGLFPVMLALEAASAISRLVCWRRPEDVSLQYG